MLQFITNASDKYSIAEEVQMAIEGGCKWIQLRMKDATYEQLRETALEIIPVCRENDVILVIDDNVELVKELHVHGVHLGKEDMPAANTADDILSFKGIDVDYVGLGPFRYTTTKKNLSPVIGLDGYRKIVDEVRKAGNELPIVAIGGITLDDIDDIMSTGVQGIAMAGSIINADDPVKYTEEVISRLKKGQQQ